jgi:hypothetical protein
VGVGAVLVSSRQLRTTRHKLRHWMRHWMHHRFG